MLLYTFLWSPRFSLERRPLVQMWGHCYIIPKDLSKFGELYFSQIQRSWDWRDSSVSKVLAKPVWWPKSNSQHQYRKRDMAAWTCNSVCREGEIEDSLRFKENVQHLCLFSLCLCIHDHEHQRTHVYTHKNVHRHHTHTHMHMQWMSFLHINITVTNFPRAILVDTVVRSHAF